MAGDQRLELRHQLRCTARGEIGVQPVLQRNETQLGQRRASEPHAVDLLELGVGIAAPQVERLTKDPRRAVVAAA